MGRDQFAGFAIKDIVVAVLAGLHRNLTKFAIDSQVGKDHILGGVVVPHIAGYDLVMPRVLARGRIQSNDGCEIQIVAAFRATMLLVPFDAVGGAEIHQIEVRVIGDATPW